MSVIVQVRITKFRHNSKYGDSFFFQIPPLVRIVKVTSKMFSLADDHIYSQ